MKKSQMRWTKRTGATILEVLVVLTIIAMIAAVVGPRVIGYLGRAKSETASLQINNLSDAVQLFYVDNGRYPGDGEGLIVLFDKPAGDAGWNGPYLETREALSDPWGRDYVYIAPSSESSFSIQSFGRDGTQGGTGEDADLGS
ncbi:general secretion pathway protein G [Litoreibacter meonggei]|uniref:General secretion pathway protein G n=1 Tax=Litoreibacter meonggei TaxID=1049199 RepID=A0A497X631_9RHOB|nr:type II secretion system major pseudopilin GspG [Litoreibacter meonggei]RLJ60749.1 general secretion pathway protein G [Litoreibacter meonggei]